MGSYFGDRISNDGPTMYLQSEGYKLAGDFMWVPPESVKTLEDMDQKDYNCLLFLVEEWDFGGLVDATSKKETIGYEPR